MKNNLKIKISFAIFSSFLLFACAPKKSNVDFDFSSLKKSSKVKIIENDYKEKDKSENMEFIKDLVPLKNKEQILSNTKFGKKDPFSRGEIKVNKLSSDFKLKGFLNTKLKKYAFVSYLENKGTITEGFIGGENTNLLPKGAKVISIDSKNKKLIINYENKKFIFEL